MSHWSDRAPVLRLNSPPFAAVWLVAGFCSVGSSVTFERTYHWHGNNWGTTVHCDRDGGYAVGAKLSLPGQGFSASIIKVDSLGDTLWVRHFLGLQGGYMCAARGSGYAIVGRSFSQSTWEDIVLNRVDSLGDSLWTFVYATPDEDNAVAIAATPDSGFILAGGFGISPNWNGGLIKVDGQGQMLWSRHMDLTKYIRLYDVRPTLDSGYVVSGYWEDSTGYGFYVAKTDSLGREEWTWRTFAPHDSMGYGTVIQAPDGCFYIAGTGSTAPPRLEAFLAKLSPEGDLLWARFYGAEGYDIRGGGALCQADDRGFLIGGTIWTASSPTHERLHIIRTDSLGRQLWAREFRGLNDQPDGAHDVRQTPDRGFIITGIADFARVYLIKTDSLGLVHLAISDAGGFRQACDLGPTVSSRSRLAAGLP